MMAEAVREFFRYYGRRADGSKALLLDTLDFYSNHSTIPMHDEGGTSDDVDFVLDREVKKLLAMVEEDSSAIGAGYQAAIALLVAGCLRKYKPLKILYVGGRLSRWQEGFWQLLQRFHPDSRLYRLTQMTNVGENYGIGIKMSFAELLLPKDCFDAVLLDDTDADLLPAMRETIILSLHTQGELIILSSRQEIMEAFLGNTAEQYELGDGWQLGHYILKAEERKAIQKDSMEGAVAAVLQASMERITLVQAAMSAPNADMDVLLEAVEQVEQYMLLIYAALPGMEVKYLANEWKRALLECRLGWGSIEKASILGEKLLLELRQ